MCDCDMYPPSVYREKTVAARKPYRCCECGDAISVGDKYQSIFGVWEGCPETFRTCLDCAAERDRISNMARKSGDCAPCIGELRDYMREDT